MDNLYKCATRSDKTLISRGVEKRLLQLIKIEKLEEMVNYEDPKTSDIHHGGKKWTKGVPIILTTKEGEKIITDHWVYINNHGGELVYNKRKNLWTQGTEYYDIGKSNIKEIYIITSG